MSLKLGDIKAGDVVLEDGCVYAATHDPARVIAETRNGHECAMLGLTGPWKGQTVPFFESVNAGPYGLRLQLLKPSTRWLL